MPVLITRERITELVMIARTQGHAGHVFPGQGGGSFGLLWSHALGRVLVTFQSGGWMDQIWIAADGAEGQIWAAINERLPWLTKARTHEVNA